MIKTFENHFRMFQGCDTDQVDRDGKPAIAWHWYYEPTDYDGDVLWSQGYADEHECGIALGNTLDELYPADNGKRTVCLNLSPDLLEKARAAGIDIGEAFEAAIEAHIETQRKASN